MTEEKNKSWYTLPPHCSTCSNGQALTVTCYNGACFRPSTGTINVPIAQKETPAQLAWLKANYPSEVNKNEVEVRQTQALETIGQSLKSVSEFLTGGGLAQVLSVYARSQSVKGMLGGLTAHDGRNALDARVLQQNAVEIVTQVEAVFNKYQEVLTSKDKRDPAIHDGEDAFNKWNEKHQKD